MTPVTVGIDPPNGGAIWSAAGPVWVGQGQGRLAVEKRRDLIEKLAAQVKSRGLGVLKCAVEEPHPRDTGGDHKGSLLSNARSSGWLEAMAEFHLAPARLPVIPANRWRAGLGINAARRAHCKERARKLFAKVHTDLGIDPGRTGEHAEEALCIAMWAWSVEMLNERVEGGVYLGWRKRGRFGVFD